MNRLEEIVLFFPGLKEFRFDLNAGRYIDSTVFIYHMDGCFEHDLCKYLAHTLDGVYFGFLDIARETDKVARELQDAPQPVVLFNDASTTDKLYNTLKPYLEGKTVIVSRHLNNYYPAGFGIELVWPCRKDYIKIVRKLLEENCQFTPNKTAFDTLWDVTSGCPETTINLINNFRNKKSQRDFLMAIIETNATTKKQTLDLYNAVVNEEIPLTEIGPMLRKYIEGNSWRQGSLFFTREMTNDILDNPEFAVSINLTELLAKPIASEAHFVAFCLDLAAKVRRSSNG